MSINGINNPLLSSLRAISNPAETIRPGTERIGNTGQQHTTNGTASPAALAAAPSGIRASRETSAFADTQQTVPAEAPPGTDPALWSVLTSEERAFFAKTAALGPLTYGRIKAAANPAPAAQRGVRLDVRA